MMMVVVLQGKNIPLKRKFFKLRHYKKGIKNQSKGGGGIKTAPAPSILYVPTFLKGLPFVQQTKKGKGSATQPADCGLMVMWCDGGRVRGIKKSIFSEIKLKTRDTFVWVCVRRLSYEKSMPKFRTYVAATGPSACMNGLCTKCWTINAIQSSMAAHRT